VVCPTNDISRIKQICQCEAEIDLSSREGLVNVSWKDLQKLGREYSTTTEEVGEEDNGLGEIPAIPFHLYKALQVLFSCRFKESVSRKQ
jgi:hypothetical protein